MKPNEKARELVEKFYECRVLDYDAAKQCALIACDEISKSHDKGLGTPLYWELVREEITKLT